MLTGGAPQFQLVDEPFRRPLFDESQRDVESCAVFLDVLKIVDNLLKLRRRLFVERRLNVELVNAQPVFQRLRVDLSLDERGERFPRHGVGREPHVEHVREALHADIGRRDFRDALNDRDVPCEDRAASELVKVACRAPVSERGDALEGVLADALGDPEDFERGACVVEDQVGDVVFGDVDAAKLVVDRQNFFRLNRRRIAFKLLFRRFHDALGGKDRADKEPSVLHDDARLSGVAPLRARQNRRREERAQRRRELLTFHLSIVLNSNWIGRLFLSHATGEARGMNDGVRRRYRSNGYLELKC